MCADHDDWDERDVHGSRRRLWGATPSSCCCEDRDGHVEREQLSIFVYPRDGTTESSLNTMRGVLGVRSRCG